MPKATHILGTPVDEEKWTHAKERAAEEGHAGDWDYVMGIYKRMSHSGEYREKFVRERKKKDLRMDEWYSKHKDWKKKLQRDGVKKALEDIAPEMRLVLGGELLDEFRCGSCHNLLFKGANLEKSVIEVKCKRCGALVSNL